MKRYKSRLQEALREGKSTPPDGFEAFLKKVEKLTDRNDHNGSILEIAKFFKYKKYVDIIEFIIKIHKLEGYMNYNLIQYRNDIMNDIYKLIEQDYGKDIKDAVYGSL